MFDTLGRTLLKQHCARLFHVARLAWNSTERKRGELEDKLADEVTEWCMWHYATGMSHLSDEGCGLLLSSSRVRNLFHYRAAVLKQQ